MFTPVSRGDPERPHGLDVSVSAVAGLRQQGPPLLNGSADKLIDFISVSQIIPLPPPLTVQGTFSSCSCL